MNRGSIYRDMGDRLLGNSITTDYHFEDRGPCWEWIGNLDGKGYGRLSTFADGKYQKRRAHRVSYEWFKGPIPPEYDVDHKCQNRACIAPDHLEAAPMLKNRGEYVQSRKRR